MNRAFSQSFNKCLLSTYYVLGFIGSSRDMVENKIHVAPVLMEIIG